MTHKKSSGLGILLLAGGVGLTALLIGPEKIGKAIENIEYEIQTAMQREILREYIQNYR
jgi:hypothetical protein